MTEDATRGYDDIPFDVADPDRPEMTWDDVQRREADALRDDERERKISEAVERMRVQDEAKHRYEREKYPPTPMPPILRLDGLLALPHMPTPFIIDGALTNNGHVLLLSQAKAGKTTTVVNVARSLADATPFLGAFAVAEPHTVVILDNEMDQEMTQRWMEASGIRAEERVYVVSMRTALTSLNLFDSKSRAEWARALAPLSADVLIFDCVKPVIDAFGLDEWRDVGRVLTHVKMLAAEAGIPSTITAHHMGWGGQRGRGDSSMVGNVDAQWKIYRADPDNEHSPAFFSAFGRGVDVAEGMLDFEPETLTLTYAEGETRATAKADDTAKKWLPAVARYIGENPGQNTSRITKERDDKPEPWPQKAVAAALAYGVESGLLVAVPTNPLVKNSPTKHYLPGDVPSGAGAE